MAEKKTTKRRSKEQTTQKLFEAGLEVFSKYGYDAATTKLVAKRAGVNEALIKRYFDGKEGLLRSLIVAFIKCTKEQASDYPPGATLREDLENFFVNRLEYSEQNRDLIRLAISRSIVDPKLSRELAKIQVDEPEAKLLERLQHFQAQGQIAADRDLNQLVMMITTQVMGILFEATVSPHSTLEQIRESIRVFSKNIALGLVAK